MLTLLLVLALLTSEARLVRSETRRESCEAPSFRVLDALASVTVWGILRGGPRFVSRSCCCGLLPILPDDDADLGGRPRLGWFILFFALKWSDNWQYFHLPSPVISAAIGQRDHCAGEHFLGILRKSCLRLRAWIFWESELAPWSRRQCDPGIRDLLAYDLLALCFWCLPLRSRKGSSCFFKVSISFPS